MNSPMIYELTHFLQKNLPPIWELIEWGNSVFFRLRYGRKASGIDSVLVQYPGFSEVEGKDIPELVSFFEAQPEDAFRFFRPHKFDEKTLRKLQKRKSFLMYCVRDGANKIVGYFFLRCFFIGKAFLGKMVDTNTQGKGIGTQMCLCAMDIAQALGIRMFETISKKNIASLRSTEKVLDVRIVEEMENNYLYIEDLRKKSE